MTVNFFTASPSTVPSPPQWSLRFFRVMIIQVEKTNCCTYILVVPSVEIRWPMLTSYIICIFLYFPLVEYFLFHGPTDHHYADLCTVSDPGRPNQQPTDTLTLPVIVMSVGHLLDLRLSE